jgi:hypothetical protein
LHCACPNYASCSRGSKLTDPRTLRRVLIAASTARPEIVQPITETAPSDGIVPAVNLSNVENCMRISFRTFVVIAVAFILAVAILTWGPWNTEHVASNPGPSGTLGSTAVDQTPPPAAAPSGTPTGAAR